MTVPIPIFKIVLVPIGYSSMSTLLLMLCILGPIKESTKDVAGIPVFRAKVPQIEPVIN